MSCWIWRREHKFRIIIRRLTPERVASYVHFYLEVMASSENISLLYHLAQKGKTVRDPESQGSSQVCIQSEI